MAQKILLVDDEEGIRKVLGLSLTDSGYQVFTAGTGEEALHVFRKIQPSVVLTDIKMPGMDGIELLKKIKEESPDTEVIMITGHGDVELAIQSLKFEAIDFITKPINDDSLEIALKRANERIFFKTKLREHTENLERLVEEKTKRLLEAERLAAVGETVAGLAHAIKNVATGLRGGAFVLEKGMELNNDKYLSQGWDMVKGDVGRMSNMALDLLNYAKEREPDYELCDPNEPVEEVFHLMLPHARECGVTVELNLDKRLRDAWLDPEGIHRCLLNLVTNAIDACRDTESSKRAGKVVLQSLKNKGYAVEYKVVDNGCGMDEETRARVFQSFFSTKGSRGTGLGLMITKKIIDEHGGVVEFESEEGKGTTFVIRLPDKDQPSGTKGNQESHGSMLSGGLSTPTEPDREEVTMVKYKELLFCTDFSEDANIAFLHALDLAERYGAKLHILHIPHSPYRYLRHVVDEHVPEGAPEGEAFYDEKVEKEAEKVFKKEYGGKLRKFKDYSFAVKVGKPDVEIIRYAKKNDIDVIVMGALGKSELERIEHGSTLANVSKYAHCHVIAIRNPAKAWTLPESMY